MLALLRREGIEGFELNARIHRYEVDILWRSELFAVEIDGYAVHSGRIPFERDRLKIATLEAHGLTVMPVTPRQIREQPRGVLDRLVRGLERSRARSRWADPASGA